MYLIHYYYCPPKHQGRAQRSDMQKSENKNILSSRNYLEKQSDSAHPTMESALIAQHIDLSQ